MTDTAHMIYAASVRQLNGVIAERDALAAALAAKQEQIAGLVAERNALREQVAGLAEVVAVPKLGLLDTGRIPQP